MSVEISNASIVRNRAPLTQSDETCELPDGFPKKIESAIAWKGQDMQLRSKEYIVELTPEDVEELSQAIEMFKGSNLPLHELSPAIFPLPKLKARLAQQKTELYNGRGFFTIRGFKSEDYTDEENIIVHLGISSYLGDLRALQQNHKKDTAEAIMHVYDIQEKQKNSGEDVFLMPGNRNIAVGFHCDNGDIVSLYCRRTAVAGGALFLSSAAAIYNELAKKNPGVIRTLSEDWVWQRNKTGDGPLRYDEQPLLYWEDGRMIINYQKRPLRGVPEDPQDPSLPALSRQQLHALEAFDELAFKLALPVEQQSGDMHFFNNLSILHARSAFTSAVEEGKQRHLTRLIFRDSEMGWKIPEKLRTKWRKYYDHKPEAELFPISPNVWAYSKCGHD